MRDRKLREAAGDWWEQERKEGKWGREDADVQRVAERLGFGYGNGSRTENDGEGIIGEGKLKSNAKMAVDALKDVFK